MIKLKRVFLDSVRHHDVLASEADIRTFIVDNFSSRNELYKYFEDTFLPLYFSCILYLVVFIQNLWNMTKQAD